MTSIQERAREALTAWGCATNPVAAAAASAAMAEVLALVVEQTTAAEAAAADDPFQDPKWKAYADRARKELEPMIADSATTVALFDGRIAPEMAIQIGYMVLLDKPIIAAVSPGCTPPKKLIAVADELIEYSTELDPAVFAQRLREACVRVDARINGDDAP